MKQLRNLFILNPPPPQLILSPRHQKFFSEMIASKDPHYTVLTRSLSVPLTFLFYFPVSHSSSCLPFYFPFSHSSTHLPFLFPCLSLFCLSSFFILLSLTIPLIFLSYFPVSHSSTYLSFSISLSLTLLLTFLLYFPVSHSSAYLPFLFPCLSLFRLSSFPFLFYFCSLFRLPSFSYSLSLTLPLIFLFYFPDPHSSAYLPFLFPCF